MKPFVMLGAPALAVLFCFENASAAQTKSRVSPKLARQVTFTLDAARRTALVSVAGTVLEEELEKDHGRPVYSFDIQRASSVITEVQVDAKEGSVCQPRRRILRQGSKGVAGEETHS